VSKPRFTQKFYSRAEGDEEIPVVSPPKLLDGVQKRFQEFRKPQDSIKAVLNESFLSIEDKSDSEEEKELT
jgi:hypothetical protein